MRIIYTLLVVLIFASCSKKDAVVSVNASPTPSVSAAQIINAAINSDFTYELPLPSSNIEIHKQASHFSLSEVTVDAKKGVTVYQYLPAKDFDGKDEVTLKDVQTSTNYSHDDGNGGCRNMGDMQPVTKTSYITIKFTVSK